MRTCNLHYTLRPGCLRQHGMTPDMRDDVKYIDDEECTHVGLSVVAVAKLKPEERRSIFQYNLQRDFRNELNSEPIMNVCWEEELRRDVKVLRDRVED